MKIKINVYLLLIFGLTMINESSLAQILYLHSSPQGIYIGVYDISPNQINGYQLEKQNQGGDYERIITFMNPESKSVLDAQLTEAYKDFTTIKYLPQVDSIWQKLNESNINPKLWYFHVPPIKVACGTAWIDKSVNKNSHYKYRLINPTGEIVFESESFTYPTSIDFPKIFPHHASEKLTFPNVTWMAEDARAIYDFDIYRTPFGISEYQEIKTPRQTYELNGTLWLKFTDTTLTEEGVHLYYIIPKDVYGNRGTASIAFQVNNLSIQTQPHFISLKAKGHPKKKTMLITWKLDRIERARGLHLYRSNAYDGKYKLIADLEPTDSFYIDPIVNSNENYYYYFKVNDLYGKSYQSVRIFGLFSGTIIPFPPRILNAEALEEGVEITWRGIGESIRGYYVLRGEGYKGDLIQVSPFIGATPNEITYIDTSTTLKGHLPYGYAVVAESDTYDRGGSSDTLFVRPKVPTSITPPMEIDVFWSDPHVKLIWSDHSKIETYIAGFNVWRKQSDEEGYTLLTNEPLPNTQTLFFDKSTLGGNQYEYAISSIDHFGAESHKSRSKSIDLRGKFYQAPEDFWAKRSDEGVLLKWVIENTDNISGFNIYRSNDNDQIVLWKSLDSSSFEFLDTELQSGLSRIYQISAVYTSGIESEKTQPVYMRL